MNVIWQIEFGYLERRSVDDWVSACEMVEVPEARCDGMNRKTWKKCDDDMKVLGGMQGCVEGLHMGK